MERPLLGIPKSAELRDMDFSIGRAEGIDTDLLYKQLYIDPEELKAKIRELLKSETQITLKQLTEVFPIEKGLAEIITLLNIASKDRKTLINELVSESITITNRETNKRFKINVPQVIFCRLRTKARGKTSPRSQEGIGRLSSWKLRSRAYGS